MRARILPLLIVVAVCSVPVLLPAQVDTGAIVGTVRDASGAVLPNANVTLTAVGTGIKTVVKTGSAGTYVATPLKIG